MTATAAEVLSGAASWAVLTGDCLTLDVEPGSVDAVVTDPPAGIAFMGKAWDHDKGGRAAWIAWMAERMRVAFRLLKPGGHAVVWALPRTSHWTATAVEDAGFEIRDVLTHHFGCLSEDTEVLIDGRWEPYQNAAAGSLALCYDTATDEYSWQPIAEVFVYSYADTAFRIHSDRTDQIVSRNHRCLVERGGGFAFHVAEALERSARVPVLEDVQGLLCALSVPDQGASGAKRGVRQSVLGSADSHGATREETPSDLRLLRHSVYAEEQSRTVGCEVLHDGMRSGGTLDTSGRSGAPAIDRVAGALGVDVGEPGVCQREDERSEQSRLEGRSDVLPQARELCADQVRPMPGGVRRDGATGRLCDGASAGRGRGDWQSVGALGGGASHGSRPDEQRANEPGPVRVEPGTQVVRGSRFTTADLAVVEPVYYEGRVWCLRVPTGAFVARRNGKVFVTGNSGFPKSLDVSKAIDSAAGAVREVVGNNPNARAGTESVLYEGTRGQALTITAPATPEAAQWQGWGTATKPATEMWILARKPLIGTVAENVLAHGTGGLNVDACRVSGPPSLTAGRWPANLLLSHSEGCVEAGEKTVRGSNKPGMDRGSALGLMNDDAWKASERKPQCYTSEDGTESVPAFDCAPDCPVAELDRQSGERPGMSGGGRHRPDYPGGMFGGVDCDTTARADSGGASRFFPTFRYVPKAPRAMREEGLQAAEGERGNDHPTVKHDDLMRWLCRLVTPPGGVVLDMFCGSGSTGRGALKEGFRFIGIDADAHYVEIAKARIEAAEERQRPPEPDRQVTIFDLLTRGAA